MRARERYDERYETDEVCAGRAVVFDEVVFSFSLPTVELAGHGNIGYGTIKSRRNLMMINTHARVGNVAGCWALAWWMNPCWSRRMMLSIRCGKKFLVVC